MNERATKNCAVCGLPFQWRRKWKSVWEEVRYCSERCRRRRNRPGGAAEEEAVASPSRSPRP
jgi:hypothetical protein